MIWFSVERNIQLYGYPNEDNEEKYPVDSAVSGKEIHIMVNIDLVLWECSFGSMCVCLPVLLQAK